MARPRKNGIAVYINGKRVNFADYDFSNLDYLAIRPDKPDRKELESLLKSAIEEERYEAAAKYRDQLNELYP